jgi:glycosyltransferase involved in cell wall biosynthesis
MRVLFVHQNFPGQYKHLAPALAARRDCEVVALAINQQPVPAGVKVVRYEPKRSSSQSVHPWVSDIETKVIRGEAAAETAAILDQKGFRPDVICAHPGWGESLFLKDVWPDARVLSFIEFYYNVEGSDFGFDKEFTDLSLASRCRLRMKNANQLLTLMASDWAVSPTEFQRQTVPPLFQSRMSVIHDGVDTAVVRPNPEETLKLEKAGVTLSRADEVITFINRNLEPYRGFHVFMRALPEIQKRRPNAWVLILGGDDVSYGAQPPKGQTYRQILLNEVGAKLDMSRIRFLGRVPYSSFLKLLQVSSAHVYLTYPFVLSWSMLEAMAAECLVIGSATAPVQEVIADGENGLLVDFFSPEAIADAIDRVLDDPDRMQPLRTRARQTVIERYDLKTVCLPRHLALVDAVAEGRLPPEGLEAPISSTAAAMRRALQAKREPEYRRHVSRRRR